MLVSLLALLLLFATYGVLGWRVSDAPEAWRLWTGVLVLGIDFALTSPLKLIRFFFGGWVSTDKNAFIAVIGGSFAAVFALVWFQYFMQLVMLLAAGVLARLELQRLQYGKWRATMVLVAVSMSGYVSGIALYRVWFGSVARATREVMEAIATSPS